MFGPRQDPDSDYAAVIPKFIKALLANSPIHIYGDGKQTRDFTYVENVVQANLRAASSPTAPGHAINVACGNAWSLLDLVDMLEEITQQKAQVRFCDPRPGDIKHSLASIVKARDLLGYQPVATFDQGIRETLEWYLHSGVYGLQRKPPAMHEHTGGVYR